jgi:hypothetical protein
MPNLTTAYRAARRATYRGRDGRPTPAPATAALAAARDNLNRFRDAAADREDKAAIRDAARIASNESEAAAGFLARAGGQPYESAAAAAAAAKQALRDADAALDAATRRLHAAARTCESFESDYGAGTWQGGMPLPESGLPFYLPPAMRQRGDVRTARAMGRGNGARFRLHDSADGTLRHVCDADSIWRDASNWYDNPYGESFRDGTGLVCGVVAQLRGRNGRAVYVAGFRFKGNDDNGTFDLAELFTADGRDESDAEAAATEAARAADSLAETAAELEREYQETEAARAAAFDAGEQWAAAAVTIAEARGAIRRLLADRRKARAAGLAELPAICRAIKDSVAGFLSDIAEARELREELASADYDTHESAFCRGASLQRMPG